MNIFIEYYCMSLQKMTSKYFGFFSSIYFINALILKIHFFYETAIHKPYYYTELSIV